MARGLSILLLAIAVLWPGRLAGPLDGAPLDRPLEAIVIGLLLPWLLAVSPRLVTRTAGRVLVLTLLAWKVVTPALLAQDGWCLRFTSPVPLYRGDLRVPHSWDVRADWRSPVPVCSAIMTGPYAELERFPAWFYNLPPADPGAPARPGDRPPNVTPSFTLEGYLDSNRDGVFQVLAGEDVTLRTRIGDRAHAADEIARGVPLTAGSHPVSIQGGLVRSHWSLAPLWNGGDLWTRAAATRTPIATIDRIVRPWGRYVPAVLIAALAGLGLAELAGMAGASALWPAAVLVVAAGAMAVSEHETVRRLVPLLLAAAILLPLPRRVQNRRGFLLLIAAPLLALAAVRGWPQAGLFTWYSSGDDWWTFQRFAYRIYLQGYWLEGGERVFWFQPFYRWIAGALHLAFGDSSVGELFWDAGCLVAGAALAFDVTRRVAGFRWGLAAAAVTLATFTMGPAWFLLGRGLSEASAMGLLSLAALLAMRARRGAGASAALAGGFCALAFFTRLNNLPMALGVAAFALPLHVPAGDFFHPRRWWPQVSRRVVAGVWGAIALGLWLFTARTYHYTGVPSMFWGTQAGLLTLWRDGAPVMERVQAVAGSVMMVLTMNDPPRADPRALPVIAGVLAAVLGLAGARPFRRLPMSLTLFALSGLAGALVARGSAYPGRFSVHLIPPAVALSVCAVWLVVSPSARARSARRAPQSPGTT